MSSTTEDAPAHPSPSHPAVRTIVSQVPQDLLSNLLVYHAHAYTPKNIVITSITPDAISLSYDQPVEDIGFKPVPRSYVLKMDPPLPPLPPQPVSNDAEDGDAKAEKNLEAHDANYAWEKACAARLNELHKIARDILEDVSPVMVTRYLPPTTIASYMSMAQFIILTGTIFVWIRYGAETPFIGGFLANVFSKEWKFNSVVLFHVAIMVRKWAGVLQMAKKLRKHGVGRKDLVGPMVGGSDVKLEKLEKPKRAIWIYWLVTAFFEGWRCEARFDDEVARVGRKLAEEEEEDKAMGGKKVKKESKKKR